MDLLTLELSAMDILTYRTTALKTAKSTRISVCEGCGYPLGICMCEDDDEDDDIEEMEGV